MSDWRRFISKLGFSGLVIAFFFIVSALLFFSSSAREGLRAFFAPAPRKILSVDNGRILPDGDGRVVKLATPDGLVLEIYGPLKNGFYDLVDRIVLRDRRDAYVQFQGRATNLALRDFDADSVFEIIAPSYDSSLVPHMNIFKYNRETQKFEPFDPDDKPLQTK